MLNIEKITDDLITQKFSVIENFCTDDLLNSLHLEITNNSLNNNLKNAGVGRNLEQKIVKNIRNDKIKWLNNDTTAQNLLFQELENLRLELNKNLILGLFDFETHFAVYEKGNFYKTHLDSFKGAKNRIISLVIYLNKKWQETDGGVLNLYQNIDDLNPLFSVTPTWGKAILFLSEEVPHEVRISNKTRYSIAAWFRVRNI